MFYGVQQASRLISLSTFRRNVELHSLGVFKHERISSFFRSVSDASIASMITTQNYENKSNSSYSIIFVAVIVSVIGTVLLAFICYIFYHRYLVSVDNSNERYGYRVEPLHFHNISITTTSGFLHSSRSPSIVDRRSPKVAHFSSA